jgi:hypothetical protein
MKSSHSLLLICLISSTSFACDDSICLPGNEKQRLNALNYSLITGRIFNAYMSSDVNQRRLAEMYVVGVIDSSEGVSWCGFDIASPDAINEQVFESLKDSMKTNPQGRAANAIKSRLEELLPCKRAES